MQLEEEKLNPTSTATSSVFIDGVEFVRVRVLLAMVDAVAQSFLVGRTRFSAQQEFVVGVIFVSISLASLAVKFVSSKCKKKHKILNS